VPAGAPYCWRPSGRYAVGGRHGAMLGRAVLGSLLSALGHTVRLMMTTCRALHHRGLIWRRPAGEKQSSFMTHEGDDDITTDGRGRN